MQHTGTTDRAHEGTTDGWGAGGGGAPEERRSTTWTELLRRPTPAATDPAGRSLWQRGWLSALDRRRDDFAV